MVRKVNITHVPEPEAAPDTFKAPDLSKIQIDVRRRPGKSRYIEFYDPSPAQRARDEARAAGIPTGLRVDTDQDAIDAASYAFATAMEASSDAMESLAAETARRRGTLESWQPQKDFKKPVPTAGQTWKLSDKRDYTLTRRHENDLGWRFGEGNNEWIADPVFERLTFVDDNPIVSTAVTPYFGTTNDDRVLQTNCPKCTAKRGRACRVGYVQDKRQPMYCYDRIREAKSLWKVKLEERLGRKAP